MLFTYTYVPHAMEKMQAFMDFIDGQHRRSSIQRFERLYRLCRSLHTFHDDGCHTGTAVPA